MSRSERTPTRRRGTLLRGSALFGMVGLLAAGVVLGDEYRAEPTRMTDGTAWVGRGDDLVRGSAFTGRADAILTGAGGAGARIAQDGRDTVIVVGGRAVSIDSSSLELGASTEVGRETVPLVRGGHAYLVARGRVDCVDPTTGRRLGPPISTNGSLGVGVVDDQGVLWLAFKRDGHVWKVRDCEVERQVRVFDAGHDVQVSLAAGRPVVYDATAGALSWIERRTGEAAVTAEVPADGELQGASSEGDRAWVTAGSEAVGVRRDGDVARVDLRLGSLLRPEVVGERVLVPSRADGGRVVVVAAPPDGRPRLEVSTDLPAAVEDDFASFVKDGQAWFSAPAAELAGTIATDGEIEDLVVQEEELRRQEQQEPPPPEEVAAPTATVPSPGTTPGTTPGTAPVTTPAAPGGGGATPGSTPSGSGTRAPAITTTTAAATTTTLPRVPDVVGRTPQDACARLAPFRCRYAPYAELAPSGQPVDRVLVQEPAAGTPAAASTEVVVRYYADEVVVPDLVAQELDLDGACQALVTAGLTCGAPVAQAFTAVPGGPGGPPRGVAVGQVWQQSATPGGRLARGTAVDLTYEADSWTVVLRQCSDPGDTRAAVTVVRDGERCPAGHVDDGPWARCSSEPGGARQEIYRLQPLPGATRENEPGTPVTGTLVLSSGSYDDNDSRGLLSLWDRANREVLCYGYWFASTAPDGVVRAAIDNVSGTYATGGGFRFLSTDDTGSPSGIFSYLGAPPP